MLSDSQNSPSDGRALAERHVGDLVAVGVDSRAGRGPGCSGWPRRSPTAGRHWLPVARRLGDDVVRPVAPVARHLAAARRRVVGRADRLQQDLGRRDAEAEHERPVAVVREEPVVAGPQRAGQAEQQRLVAGAGDLEEDPALLLEGDLPVVEGPGDAGPGAGPRRPRSHGARHGGRVTRGAGRCIERSSSPSVSTRRVADDAIARPDRRPGCGRRGWRSRAGRRSTTTRSARLPGSSVPSSSATPSSSAALAVVGHEGLARRHAALHHQLELPQVLAVGHDAAVGAHGHLHAGGDRPPESTRCARRSPSCVLAHLGRQAGAAASTASSTPRGATSVGTSQVPRSSIRSMASSSR